MFRDAVDTLTNGNITDFNQFVWKLGRPEFARFVKFCYLDGQADTERALLRALKVTIE